MSAARRWMPALLSVAVLAAVGLGRTYVFGVVSVSTGSMSPSVLEGDVLLYDRLAAPTLGDIVVLQLPGDSEQHLKRLVAMGPAEVEVARGLLYVDGEQVGQPQDDKLIWTDGHCQPQERVGVQERSGARRWSAVRGGDSERSHLIDGELWLLGDRRPTSEDSRLWGPVPEQAVLGVAKVIVASRRSCDRVWRWRRLGYVE